MARRTGQKRTPHQDNPLFQPLRLSLSPTALNIQITLQSPLDCRCLGAFSPGFGLRANLRRRASPAAEQRPRTVPDARDSFVDSSLAQLPQLQTGPCFPLPIGSIQSLWLIHRWRLLGLLRCSRSLRVLAAMPVDSMEMK